jgi:hypothetical protein
MADEPGPTATTQHLITHIHMKTPHLMASTVNAYYGKVVVDKWGLLDPMLAERQINAQVGSPHPFRKNGPLDRGINDPHGSPDGLALAMGLAVS